MVDRSAVIWVQKDGHVPWNSISIDWKMIHKHLNTISCSSILATEFFNEEIRFDKNHETILS